ncbi:MULTISPECIES: MlaC/ttg2D family ABC transporter substrate-binding protein [Aquitalea]|uniref:Phospholipid transport system substrate-binding protein n=1 Tax=Aquitalea magnusonii TaxID=332411 RepID=A0A318JHV8_9NEIS|nr:MULTISPECIES: ABC transporter substrate-binding protein [Aquitalea]PXX39842.1 phospholipid transport system substrate-binding protein [Aquitalea magnusonii]
MKKLIACFLVLLGLSAHTMAATDNPADLVRDTSRQIMDVLKQENGKNTKQIRQQVEALAVPQFDFQRMTALAVGLGWRQASPAQQSALAQQFQTLLVRTYSTTMTRFKSAQIDIQPNVVLGNSGREATVKSTVSLPGNDKGPVAVDYTLYKTPQGWKVFNVSVEGASLVTVYRNQFNQEINKNGVDGLIKMLQDKNAALPAAK